MAHAGPSLIRGSERDLSFTPKESPETANERLSRLLMAAQIQTARSFVLDALIASPEVRSMNVKTEQVWRALLDDSYLLDRV
jgi:hypothetical protein